MAKQAQWQNRIVGYADVDPKTLVPNPANYRRHPKRQADATTGSLNELGWVQDVLVNKTSGRIVDGHLRVELALQHGAQTVPVKYVELSEAEERLALATLDPLTYMAETDATTLEALLQQVNTGDAALQEMLAGLAEENGLFKTEPVQDVEPQIDRAAELRVKWGVESGQMWRLGEHRIICGDCTDVEVVARVMGGEKAALCFTSPPYNGNTHMDYGKGRNKKLYELFVDNLSGDEYIAFCHKVIDIVRDNLDGFLFWNISYNSNSRWEFVDSIYPYKTALHEVIIWKKKGMPIPSGLTRDYEFIFCLKFGNSQKHISKDFVTVSNFWEISNMGAHDISSHRAAFPIELPMRALREASAENATILDPFSGSGTTIIACENLGRKCRAVEISPAYVAVAIERWATATGKTPERLP